MPRIVNVIRAYNTEYKQACTWCIIMLCGISEAESATSAAKYRVKFNDSTLLCLSQKHDGLSQQDLPPLTESKGTALIMSLYAF